MSGIKRSTQNQQSRTIYFSIEGGGGGFTDQILKFNAFYKLGRVLGYIYIHKKFSVYRRDVFSSQMLEKIMQNKVLYSVYRRFFGFDVYSFLGLNSYLESLHGCKTLPETQEVVVGLSDEILEKAGINSAEGLINFVRQKVDSCTSNHLPAQVILRLERSKWKFFRLIFDKFTEYPDNISLYKAYLDARKIKPWRSLYTKGKYRVLVHMRQGDTALIQTPWGSYIPIYGIRHSHKELQTEDDVSGIFITTQDYFCFIKNLNSYLGNDIFSFVFSTDGFVRAFRMLFSNIRGFQFSVAQVNALKEAARNYDEKEFNQLKAIPDSVVVVGENRKNLKDLIHSALMADVIISGSQQHMMKKLYTSYYDPKRQPIFVNLYKGHFMPEHYLFPLEKRVKIVNVNLLNYDIEKVANTIIQNLENTSG